MSDREQPTVPSQPDRPGQVSGDVHFEVLAGLPSRDLVDRVLFYDRLRDLEIEIAGSGVMVWRAVVAGASVSDVLALVRDVAPDGVAAVDQTEIFLDGLVDGGVLRRV